MALWNYFKIFELLWFYSYKYSLSIKNNPKYTSFGKKYFWLILLPSIALQMLSIHETFFVCNWESFVEKVLLTINSALIINCSQKSISHFISCSKFLCYFFRNWYPMVSGIIFGFCMKNRPHKFVWTLTNQSNCTQNKSRKCI